MNREIRDQWTAALRSGEFRQGRQRLVTHSADPDEPPKYCCLGVLCELAARAGAIPPADGNLYLNCFDVLPDEVVAWSGIRSRNPLVDTGSDSHIGSRTRTLAELNDAGLSFAEIADIIEREL